MGQSRDRQSDYNYQWGIALANCIREWRGSCDDQRPQVGQYSVAEVAKEKILRLPTRCICRVKRNSFRRVRRLAVNYVHTYILWADTREMQRQRHGWMDMIWWDAQSWWQLIWGWGQIAVECLWLGSFGAYWMDGNYADKYGRRT